MPTIAGVVPRSTSTVATPAAIDSAAIRASRETG